MTNELSESMQVLYNQYTVFGVSLCKYTTFRVLECVLYMPACDPG